MTKDTLDVMIIRAGTIDTLEYLVTYPSRNPATIKTGIKPMIIFTLSFAVL